MAARAPNALIRPRGRRGGHPLDFDHMDPKAFLSAMVRSFFGKNDSLAEQIEALIAPQVD